MRIAGALWCLAAMGLIAGCESSRTTPLDVTDSSVRRAASQQSLIWTIAGYVYSYTFSGQKVSELDGFREPVGLCSDPSSDLYVVDAGTDLIYEYAPGQVLPFYIYDDLYESPNSCSFDPTTGNLAVANSANVTIFPPASGTPLTYTATNMKSYAYLDYDASGNLYVDGEGLKGGFALAMLVAQSNNLTGLSLSNLGSGKHRAGGLIWDGQDIAVADPLSTVIDRISISGSKAEIVDSWHIPNWKLHYDPVFAIDRARLLFPRDGELEFFSYPPKGPAKNGFTGDIGTVLTIAPEVTN